MQQRLRVLFLPSWYPAEDNPVSGLYIREHARAAFLYNDIVVLYAYADENLPPWSRFRATEDVEDGIRTIRVKFGKYWGILGHLKRLVRKNRIVRVGSESPPKEEGGPIGAILATLTFDKTIIGDVIYCWCVFNAFRRLVKGGWRPDIIHAHAFIAGVPAAVLGRLHRIPVVTTEHYTDFQTRKLTFPQRAKARFAMNRSRMVLPVSKVLEDSIRSYGVNSHFRIVPNVVNTRLFCPASRDEERKDGRKHLLLVAVLGPRKGIPYLLEALDLVRKSRDDFVLDIVGDGPQRIEYEQITAMLDLQKNVAFHGRQPEVHSIMRKCDFFVLPSLCENFGVVYIEAMACGKPVIASNIPGPNEFINQELGILAPPGDVDALAKAIGAMLDHYKEYPAEKIAQYVRERFSYEVVGSMLDRIYREIANP
jgi:glycosyltransferase involved in cell wall biosynthesis